MKEDPAWMKRTKGEAEDIALNILNECLDDKDADFGKLARDFSDCYLTNGKQGDLGWIAKTKKEPGTANKVHTAQPPKGVDRNFEDIAFSLKEGEISDIIPTSMGIQLVQWLV